MDIKICTKCSKEKTEMDFYKNVASCIECCAEYARNRRKQNPGRYRERSRKYRQANKEKIRESGKIYRSTNRKKILESRKKWQLKNRFRQALKSAKEKAKDRGYVPCSATVGEIKAAFTGKCHVCEIPELELYAKLCLDHLHTGDGRFRGWLCHRCNRTAGLLCDSPEIALAMAEYLEYHTTPTSN